MTALKKTVGKISRVDSVALDPALRSTGVASGRQPIVAFDNGDSYVLDESHPQSGVWGSILNELKAAHEPAYVEADPATNAITRLLLPRVLRVERISNSSDGLSLEFLFEGSHARHLLPHSHPEFQEIERTLRDANSRGAAVLVTDASDRAEIVDARLVPVPFAEPSATGATGASPLVLAPAMVSPAQAQQLFALVAEVTCAPKSIADPCIPFLYPDDGCWARAHEMCRLMLVSGLLAPGQAPRKVWLDGQLTVQTRNSPSCSVPWGWHVAPTLGVGGGLLVIDPSLFDEPVAFDRWKGLQGDDSAKGTETDGSVYNRNRDHTRYFYDPDYRMTRQDLGYFRRQLQIRVSGYGAPPYANCP